MNWQNDAACRGMASTIFFPPSTGPLDFTQAKATCETCPVRIQCLDAGMNEPYGIWGGHTPEEREALRNKRYPNRTRIQLDKHRPCQRCEQDMYIRHAGQKWCDRCRVIAGRQRERDRRAIARRNQTTDDNQGAQVRLESTG